MYIVSLTYNQPIDAVDAHLAGHIDWLDRYFAQGLFLAAGRKVPRNGGVIMVQNVDRDELARILAEDPFQAVADYEVTELAVTRTQEALAALQGQ